MKQILLSLMLMLSLCANAQSDSIPTSTPQLCIGYLSYDAALKSMPRYTVVQDSLNRVREAYQKEIERVEKEFNQKYEDFLEGQRNFPRTILLKRQNELQEMMQRNIDFKTKARKELQQVEQDAMQSLCKRLNKVLATVAAEYNLTLIVNTDSNACPFIEPRSSMDIQNVVEEYLK